MSKYKYIICLCQYRKCLEKLSEEEEEEEEVLLVVDQLDKRFIIICVYRTRVNKHDKIVIVYMTQLYTLHRQFLSVSSSR